MRRTVKEFLLVKIGSSVYGASATRIWSEILACLILETPSFSSIVFANSEAWHYNCYTSLFKMAAAVKQGN